MVFKKRKYHRVILKLGGELFGEDNGKGISFSAYKNIAKALIKIKEKDLQLSIVVGGGNIFRGRQAEGTGVNEAVADSMGMLTTIINGLGLQDGLERMGMETRMMTSVEMSSLAEPYIRRRALRHLEKGRIVIFGGGIGNPYFTTDSAAALRACELNCDLILKATDVDGVYSADPNKDPKAKKYTKLSYKQAMEKNLGIMDKTAFSICWKKKKPIVVFHVKDLAKIPAILKGEEIGTLVS